MIPVKLNFSALSQMFPINDFYSLIQQAIEIVSYKFPLCLHSKFISSKICCIKPSILWQKYDLFQIPFVYVQDFSVPSQFYLVLHPASHFSSQIHSESTPKPTRSPLTWLQLVAFIAVGWIFILIGVDGGQRRWPTIFQSSLAATISSNNLNSSALVWYINFLFTKPFFDCW